MKRLYFYSTDLEEDYGELEDVIEKGAKISVEKRYSGSPDIAMTLVVRAESCPLFVIRKVPQDYEILRRVFEVAVEELNLDAGRQLVYRGESMSQVTERLRLEVSRVVRHRWTTEERERVRIDQNGACNECEAPLVAATFHLDHIRPLPRRRRLAREQTGLVRLLSRREVGA